MSSPKKKIKIFVCVLILFFSFLIFKAVESSLVYYLTVTEALESKSKSKIKRLRVSGIVEKGSIKKNIDGSITFNITDFEKIIHVRYKGEIPDIFKDEIEAVVEGELVDKTFIANKLFAKCPTKYEDEPVLNDKVSFAK
ncbi:cytochrome c maturation protein CcmE [bacterium]|nr:cytochrome c maturation protein CcmE [bacterium]|tara:strand:+ start:27408 stop:27824 length:417 start_codon:yes stop_codon:yes gene_type:complete